MTFDDEYVIRLEQRKAEQNAAKGLPSPSKPCLPPRAKRGPIEEAIINMQAHDLRGNDWTRDMIGAYLRYKYPSRYGGDACTE